MTRGRFRLLLWGEANQAQSSRTTGVIMAETSRDTGPLEEWQLSQGEYEAITAIEHRLFKAKDSIIDPDPSGAELYLPRVQHRQPRVLLLDGGRGTGKTSLLVTLIERWKRGRGGLALSAEPAEAVVTPGERNELKNRPSFVTPVANIDFDPLPPGMPLLAGLVQAWRPLVRRFDQLSSTEAESDERSLLDEWHALFQMAAAGWTAVPQERGFVAQVLDREEQVQDWLNFSRQWSLFINKVLSDGQKLRGPDKLCSDTVFVIMIDDCDLQVSRIKELLPALRLLYHPRVFFIVAADKPHMLEMLRLDFLGQQNRLAGHLLPPGEATDYHKNAGRWADSLAYSTFEKVFTKENRWRLGRLSLLEFLAFPGHAPDAAALEGKKKFVWRPDSFYLQLNKIKPTGKPDTKAGAGDTLLGFARLTERFSLPGVMTFRQAQQLLQFAAEYPLFAPADILAGLISSGERDLAQARRDTQSVEVLLTAELMSLFQASLVEFAGYEIVMGTRPDFALVDPATGRPLMMSSDEHKRVNFTALLAAKLLEDRGYPVSAAGLRWENHLSLAWTEWREPRASFRWTRHKHPQPDQLFQQAIEWNDFVSQRRSEAFEPDRYAFAWIYFERKWNGVPADPRLDPMSKTFATRGLNWQLLLSSPKMNAADKRKWYNTTLPLLARPEIGFSPELQSRLLAGMDTGDQTAIDYLRDQRRRHITDALVEAAAQRGEDVRPQPDAEQVDRAAHYIDRAFEKANEGKNRWSDIIESAGQDGG